MDLATRAEIARVLYSYLTRSAELHLFLQSRVVQVLTRLVKKRDLPELVLPWYYIMHTSMHLPTTFPNYGGRVTTREL